MKPLIKARSHDDILLTNNFIDFNWASKYDKGYEMESVAFSEDAERARKLRDPTAEAKDMIDRLEYFINDMERKTFDMHLVEDYRMGFSLKYVKEFA